jgi:hypothetical protein
MTYIHALVTSNSACIHPRDQRGGKCGEWRDTGVWAGDFLWRIRGSCGKGRGKEYRMEGWGDGWMYTS